ncbi:MAG: amidohydrolase [Halanaerobiales bacterium]|nr:amidohydrolase [Halanaerobiales bacterium]
MEILLKNIEKIFTPNQDLSAYHHIIISGKTIKKITKENEFEENNFDKVINCKDMIALPGLINTHTHSSMSILRGYADDYTLDKWLKEKIWPAEAKLTKEDIYWGAMLAVLEMIKTGTTTFTDMYFQMDEVAEVVKKSGIRAVLGEGLIEENDGIEGLNNSLDFALRWNNQEEGRLKTCLAPHSAYTCSPEYLEKIRNIALENDLLVNIHVSETKDEEKNIKNKYHLSTVKLLDDINLFDAKVIAPHCVHVSDSEIEILKNNNVGVAYNPTSNMKLSSGIAPIKKLIDNGISVSYGTDGAASNNNLDLIEEARMGSYLQKVYENDPTVLPIEETLQMLTINGAENLYIPNLGKIKEGFLADIILLDSKNVVHQYPSYNYLSNIFYAGNGNDVNTVIVNGEIIMKNREMKFIDEEVIYEKIKKLTQKYV